MTSTQPRKTVSGTRSRFYCAFCGLRGQREVSLLCPHKAKGYCAAKDYAKPKAER